MQKKNINLLIDQQKDPEILNYAKLFLPVTSVVILVVFILIFFGVLSYYNANIAQYNSLKSDILNYEQRILSKKNSAVVYTKAGNLLDNLDKITATNKNFYPLLLNISSLATEGIKIYSANTDNKGSVTMNLMASSSASLDNFVKNLKKKDDVERVFSKIIAHGIARDHDGKFTFSITLNADSSLYK
jgi:hypothetical protein